MKKIPLKKIIEQLQIHSEYFESKTVEFEEKGKDQEMQDAMDSYDNINEAIGLLEEIISSTN